MSALKITKENFEAEVLQSDIPVLLDFWSERCGPCMMLSPVVDELAGETTNAKICKVNVDEQPDLARQFRVMRIPTLVVIKDGKSVKTSVGVIPKAEIVAMLSEFTA